MGKQFLLDLFDGNFHAGLPVLGPPNHGERTQPDSRAQYVVSNKPGLADIHF
uniref:Uncharacterized protein n=1 Tax=Rhizophora mucronata TaxID=61149 RepID=A0A2P2IPM3_RHIMU